MNDEWQPDDVTDRLVADIKANEPLWNLLRERFQESKRIEELEHLSGKRWFLEPDAFPQRSTPAAATAIATYLERVYGKPYIILGGQLAMKINGFFDNEA